MPLRLEEGAGAIKRKGDNSLQCLSSDLSSQSGSLLHTKVWLIHPPEPQWNSSPGHSGLREADNLIRKYLYFHKKK